MITTANVYVAIKQRLELLFNNVEIKDIKTITKPCFYIECTGSNNKTVANETMQSQMTFNVVYFAENNELSELLAKEIILKVNFIKPLKVGSKHLTPTIAFEVDELDEYTLTMSLEFDFYQNNDINPYADEPNNELMQNLNVKINKN